MIWWQRRSAYRDVGKETWGQKRGTGTETWVHKSDTETQVQNHVNRNVGAELWVQEKDSKTWVEKRGRKGLYINMGTEKWVKKCLVRNERTDTYLQIRG
jgi:hypothetical protein